MSELSSKQKGNILEFRLIELIYLGASGRLSCFIPDSDDDGIDAIVNLKGSFTPIFLQVKSRYNLNNGQFLQDIGTNTFRVDKRFYIVFFYYNIQKYEIENIWLIPSKDFKEKSVEINPKDYKQKLRFTASPKEGSNDKWSEYKVKKSELAKRIESLIKDLYVNDNFA